VQCFSLLSNFAFLPATFTSSSEKTCQVEECRGTEEATTPSEGDPEGSTAVRSGEWKNGNSKTQSHQFHFQMTMTHG
jgi:hypothetical protein